MKALHYLASKGVPPAGNRDSLIRTILWFSPFGHKQLTIYPDSKWVEDPERRRRMFCWLDGDVESIYEELNEISISDLVRMLEDCMDTIVWDYGVEHRVRNLVQGFENSRNWASLWNGFIGLEGEGAWDNKFEIVEAYSNENRWGEEAQQIIDICERWVKVKKNAPSLTQSCCREETP